MSEHITITHSTIVSNSYDTSLDNASGVYVASGPSFTMTHTIVAHNDGADCIGTVIDGGTNIDSDSSCAWSGGSSLSNTDPLLEPLADNGGAAVGPELNVVQSHALQAGSPAVDAATGSTETADQRGVARPQGLFNDIGAFELMNDSAVTPTVTISWTIPHTATLSWPEESANVSYEIFRSETPYSGFVSQGSISDGPFVQEVNAGSIVNYFYTVRASGSGGDTADSETVGLFQFLLTPGD